MSEERRTPSEVEGLGKAFVKEYYSRYSRRPLELIDMFSKDSLFCHCDIGASPGFIRGLEKIKLELESLGNVGERKFKLLTVDCMPSLAGSVIVQNTGVMLTREAYRDFAHTFVLAPTRTASGEPSGWYVHNDFMRLGENQEDVKGEVDEEEEEEEEEEAAPQTIPSAPRENAWGSSTSAAAKIRTTAPPPPSPPPADRAPSPPPDQKKGGAPPAAPAATRSPARQASPEASPKQSPKVPPPQRPAPPPPAQPPRDADAPREGRQGRAKKAAVQKVEEEPAEEKPAEFVSWAALVSTAPASGAGGRTTRVTAPSAAKPAKPVEEERPKKSAGPGRDRSPQSRPAKPTEEQTPAKFRWASLYVTQLPEGFMEEDVEKTFGVYGEIKGNTFKASERYCFVDFEKRESVERALVEAEGDGIMFKGTRLRVQERKSPEQRAAERNAAGPKARPAGGKGSGGGKGRREAN